jgi:hypothetical protein
MNIGIIVAMVGAMSVLSASFIRSPVSKEEGQ